MILDQKCIEALEKVGLQSVALALSVQCQKTGACTGQATFHFLSEEEETDAIYVASLAVIVTKVK